MNRYGHLFDGLDQGLIDGLDAAHDEAVNPPDNVKRLPRAGRGRRAWRRSYGVLGGVAALAQRRCCPETLR
jgi:hypothetical protein